MLHGLFLTHTKLVKIVLYMYTEESSILLPLLLKFVKETLSRVNTRALTNSSQVLSQITTHLHNLSPSWLRLLAKENSYDVLIKMNITS